MADYFEMYNGVSESSEDLDLGSGGPLLLPDQTDASGIVHHLIVGAGKDRNIYLGDRDNLGKFNPATNPADNNIYQQLTGAMAGLVYSSPAYFNGVLYYAADGDSLKAFPLTNAQLATSSIECLADKVCASGADADSFGEWHAERNRMGA